MAILYDLARMTTATVGTGTITLGSAVPGYLSFALAGASPGDILDYAIFDYVNNASEMGTGTYNGTTLTRTPTKSTNGNAAISLSGTSHVFISPRAETLNDASLFTSGQGALTKTDDTNVTLTLGGTPSTSLLKSASLTLGWAGTLAVTRGGTGSSTAGGALNNLGVGSLGIQSASAVSITGGTITGMPSPSNASDVANKSYVDGLVSAGFHVLNAVQAATSTVLTNSPAYLNGASGVGATLTATTNGALSIDSVSLVNGNTVLIKNQASAIQNGIYTVTDAGSGGTKYILTRSTEADTPAKLSSSYVLIAGGTVNSSSGWVSNSVGSIGTDPVNWTQFSATSGVASVGGLSGVITLGAGLGASGTDITFPTAQPNAHTWAAIQTFSVAPTGTGITNLFGAPPLIGVTDYAYIGSFNSGTGPVYPNSNSGLASALNFSGGNVELDLWNTFLPGTYANTSIRFLQKLTASTYRELLKLQNNGSVVAPGSFAAGSNTAATAFSIVVSGGASGTGAGSYFIFNNNHAWILGNYSGVLGGAYNDDFIMFNTSSGNILRISDSTRAFTLYGTVLMDLTDPTTLFAVPGFNQSLTPVGTGGMGVVTHWTSTSSQNGSSFYPQCVVTSSAQANGSAGAISAGTFCQSSIVEVFGALSYLSFDDALSSTANLNGVVNWCIFRGNHAGTGTNTIDILRVMCEASGTTNPRMGVYVYNNTSTNAVRNGVVVSSAIDYGVRVGEVGGGGSIIEPTHPFSYIRANGVESFYVDQAGGEHATSNNTISDRALKNSISNIENGALEKISKINAVNFAFNGDKTNRKRAHVIAQEVQEQIPEAVIERDDGLLEVDQGALIAYLIKSVQELSSERDAIS